MEQISHSNSQCTVCSLFSRSLNESECEREGDRGFDRIEREREMTDLERREGSCQRLQAFQSLSFDFRTVRRENEKPFNTRLRCLSANTGTRPRDRRRVIAAGAKRVGLNRKRAATCFPSSRLPSLI